MLHVCPTADAQGEFAKGYRTREAAAVAPTTEDEWRTVMTGLSQAPGAACHNSRGTVNSSAMYIAHVLICRRMKTVVYTYIHICLSSLLA